MIKAYKSDLNISIKRIKPVWDGKQDHIHHEHCSHTLRSEVRVIPSIKNMVHSKGKLQISRRGLKECSYKEHKLMLHLCGNKQSADISVFPSHKRHFAGLTTGRGLALLLLLLCQQFHVIVMVPVQELGDLNLEINGVNVPVNKVHLYFMYECIPWRHCSEILVCKNV